MADDDGTTNGQRRGSFKSKLPVKDKGKKHSSKISASREVLSRQALSREGFYHHHSPREAFPLYREATTSPLALDEAPPATPASQLIEDWNGEAETGGRGRLLSSFKERVHGMTQRQSSQSQVQIEKELRLHNELQTKVAASVDEKFLDYASQMQAANRHIAVVTAKLHDLSANISEDKITQLLAGIVQPYFDALSGDTSRRLNEMEERARRLENDRTERFEKELSSTSKRLRDLESAARETNKSVCDINATFKDIKDFTESIPKLAKETQDLAETVTRRLMHEADDANRAETLKLNRFRLEEVRKVEQSLQSVGEAFNQKVKTDFEDLRNAVKSDLGKLTESFVSNTAEQVDKIDHAVTTGKVHVEYIQDNVVNADKNLDRSFNNLASEVRRLNEDVASNIKMAHEAEKEFRRTQRDSGVFLDDYLQKFEQSTAKAGDALGQYAQTIELDTGKFEMRILEASSQAEEKIWSVFGRLAHETSASVESQVGNIQGASSTAEVELARTFERLTKTSEESLDGCIAKIQHVTTQSETSLSSTLTKLTKETADSLDGHIEAIQTVTSQAGDAESARKQEMEERYMTILQTSNEERQKDLQSVYGRLEDLDRIVNLIATEAGCITNTSVSPGINLPDSPVTPGFPPSPSTTIRSRFDETTSGISELLEICRGFRTQVDDISAALGVVPTGETFGTMLESSFQTTTSLSKAIGIPTGESSLWSIMENSEKSLKNNEETYERLESIFQETRSLISHANEALGSVPTALQEITTSASGITNSIIASHTVAEESATLTEAISTSLLTTNQALEHCKHSFTTMNHAITKSHTLANHSFRAVSDLQEILLDTSTSVVSLVHTSSNLSTTIEKCKSSIDAFKTEIEFFKDSVLTTKESIDGALTLSHIYHEEIRSTDDDFRIAIEDMGYVAMAMRSLGCSVADAGDGMERTMVTIAGARNTLDNLGKTIVDADFSIESFAANLATFGETVRAAENAFSNVAATVQAGTRPNIKWLVASGDESVISAQEKLIQDITTRLAALTELATDPIVVKASSTSNNKWKELDDQEEDTTNLPSTSTSTSNSTEKPPSSSESSSKNSNLPENQKKKKDPTTTTTTTSPSSSLLLLLQNTNTDTNTNNKPSSPSPSPPPPKIKNNKVLLHRSKTLPPMTTTTVTETESIDTLKLLPAATAATTATGTTTAVDKRRRLGSLGSFFAS